MKQFTQEQAVAIAEGGEWKDWTDEEVVKFQLYQKRLCMDFHRFHVAVGNVLGRPVFTHEFANSDALKEEYEGKRPAPTFEEIINMIPAEKRVLLKI
jgi:hypothetical protein